MARGDWNIVEKSTGSSNFKAGFEWKYANTSEEAQATNKDVINVRMFARIVNSTSSTYNLNNLTSYVKYTIGTSETKLDVVTEFDFRNKGKGTYYLGNSLPFNKVSGAGEIIDGINIFKIEVEHNEDGSAPAFNITTFWNDSATSIGSVTTSQDIALDTIPRASSLNTIQNFNISDTITISINKYVSTYTDNLLVKVGDTTIKTINAISNNYSLTFTATEKNAIKNLMTSPQIIVTFELQTYNGSTLIGTSIQNAICTDLDQPIMNSFFKNATGYIVGINGVVNTSLKNGAQVFGELYKNGNFVLSGKILYENEEGTNEDITLSGNVSEYDFLEIYFKKENYSNSCKIDNPNKKYANLMLQYPTGATSNSLQSIGLVVYLEGTSLTRWSKQLYYNVTSTASTIKTGTETTLVITKVVGYN